MANPKLYDILERSPVIAAVRDDLFSAAVLSPCEVIFYLKANLNTLKRQCEVAHKNGKYLFVHIDLAEGIGKDKASVEYLATMGIDGIVSTRGNIIRWAKECGMMTVQRFFALDSKGIESIDDTLRSSNPHMMEIMPGVIHKAIRKFSSGHVPVIAGGLIQTKSEVTDALGCGATAVSTSSPELWHL